MKALAAIGITLLWFVINGLWPLLIIGAATLLFDDIVD